MDLIKLVSDINVLKFFRPTNVSFGEYAPFSNNDIRNTFKVGNIINTKNKITAGAMHTAKKPLRPLAFFSYGGSSLWGFTILLFVFLRIDAGRGKR